MKRGENKTPRERCQQFSKDFFTVPRNFLQAGKAMQAAVPFVGVIGNQLQGGIHQGQGLFPVLLAVFVPLGQFLAGEAVGGPRGKRPGGRNGTNRGGGFAPARDGSGRSEAAPPPGCPLPFPGIAFPPRSGFPTGDAPVPKAIPRPGDYAGRHPP